MSLGSPGPTCYNNDDPVATFSSFFADELLTTLVEKINRYAAQFASRQPAATDQTGVEKLKAYFGLLVLMGINQLPKM